MVLSAKDALGRVPRINEDLLDIRANYFDRGDPFWIAVDENDYTSIYINARWPREKQRRAFRHELRHIENDDIYNAKDIRTVEREADGVPARSPGAPADGWQNDIYLALPLFD